MATVVMTPSAVVDFNFNFDSAPSSPPRFFFSAPTSPLSSVPFSWEEKPGIAKSTISTATSSNYGDAEDEIDSDFAFDFSRQLETNSLSADQLFHGGKIKPLKPPPVFHHDQYRPSPLVSPKSPKRILHAFSPRRRNADFDPFAAALEKTRKGDDSRGRERSNKATSSSRNKQSRSVSPLRVSDMLFDPEPSKKPSFSSSPLASFWKMLFRSVSEGRASDKQQQKKYGLLQKDREDDVVNGSSFRSTESVGSVSSRRRSAHELHYTVNRAITEEMKKRTSLAYKQGGLLSCLGFHPTASMSGL